MTHKNENAVDNVSANFHYQDISHAPSARVEVRSLFVHVLSCLVIDSCHLPCNSVGLLLFVTCTPVGVRYDEA